MLSDVDGKGCCGARERLRLAVVLDDLSRERESKLSEARRGSRARSRTPAALSREGAA